MSIKIIMIGKTNESYITEGITVFLDRLKHYFRSEWIELPIKKTATTIDQLLSVEGLQILKLVEKSDYLVLLDEKGKEFSSTTFAGWLEKHLASSGGNLIFVIGGAYGFHNTVYERANMKMALSQMTFTHQMVRLIFVEQLYRAFTIIKNEKYHH